ncbi:MAG: DMT family transporter [Bacilli bacterium]|nr:DMT family transporter [Bacilli bacterium]MBN2876185.1 DMT family transporter [Bacilli bacterium]
MKQDKTHLFAILQALLVTFLWSASFLLILYGLGEVPPVTFAGLRYAIAAFVLFGYLLVKKRWNEFKLITKKQWLKLIALGLVMYFLNQGALYLGLTYITPVQVSLVMNFTPIVVLVFSYRVLQEKPTRNNLIGIGIYLIGIALYFFPLDSGTGSIIGYLIMLVAVFSNGSATLMGRDINKQKTVSPEVITTISMGLGGGLLLLSGFAFEDPVVLEWDMWLVVIVLAILNTAFAFTLWNKTMQVLTSIESSMINNTMLIQIAILSWLFLKEPFQLKSIIAILIVSAGVYLVQFKSKKQLIKESP